MKLLLLGEFDVRERARWARTLDAALAAVLPAHELLLSRDAPGADATEVAIVANPPPGSLARLPRLRLIQSLWAGVDRLLADPTLPAEVPIARLVDPALSAAMAETALWATIALHRGFFGYARQQAAGQWKPLPQRRANEMPVLVLGYGEMGRCAARRLSDAGYPVTAWRRTAGAPGDRDVSVCEGDAALAAALAENRIVVNLLPLTAETRDFFDADRLATMRRGASLVNLARGAHVVEADLLAALDAGTLAHAVLDVFRNEPLPPGHPFWQHPRVTVLPHAAALSDARSAAVIVASNIAALAGGRPIAHRVERARGY